MMATECQAPKELMIWGLEHEFSIAHVSYRKNPGIPGTPNPQQLAGHSQYGHINAVVIVVVIPILILIIVVVVIIIIIIIINIIIIIIFIFIIIIVIIIFIFIFIIFIFIFIFIVFFIMFFTAIIFIRIMWFIIMMCLFPGRVDCARITSDPLASTAQGSEDVVIHQEILPSFHELLHVTSCPTLEVYSWLHVGVIVFLEISACKRLLVFPELDEESSTTVNPNWFDLKILRFYRKCVSDSEIYVWSVFANSKIKIFCTVIAQQVSSLAYLSNWLVSWQPWPTAVTLW